MMISNIEIEGKKYQLQHPGAQAYFLRKKKLNRITTNGFIEWDEAELFDFCFGVDPADNRVVTREDGSHINWREAGINEGNAIPAVSELSEVWAVILPGFLARGERSDPDDGKRWKWINKDNAGDNKTDPVKTDKGSGRS